MPSRVVSYLPGPPPTPGNEPGSLARRFATIREQLHVPAEFPPDVLAAATGAADLVTAPSVDLTDLGFWTLDPVGSMDLDQAVHIEREGSGFRVRYAIADVAQAVTPGGALDRVTRERGTTVYGPATRLPLHPPVLSEGVLSLLPGVDRFAYLWDVRLDARGEQVDAQVRRAVVRSRARLSYAGAQAAIDDGALTAIIERYTREAGVRNLEREIGQVLRHAAVRIAEGSATEVKIAEGDLAVILGAPRFENEMAQRTSVPGVATGLAWTPVGGDILFIEAARMPGSGKLTLTGQLGEVMRESAIAALSLVKSRSDSLGVDTAALERSDIHVHVPAGATPKDGPSAGVAMFLALVSLLTGRTVRSDTAMTGEISLRGLVLPVGGIKEKVIAAAGAGIKRVMLPARNRRDYDDIPENARAKLEFIWLERVEDAMAAGLEP